MSEDDYVEGAPELIAEIAASSASLDAHEKMRVYRRNGVNEYLLWRVFDNEIDWFTLEGTTYVALPLDHGLLKSRTLPGLWLDPSAIKEGDMAHVLATLQRGLEFSEHALFVKRLSGRGT